MNQTQTIVGNNKDVSDVPISLSIFSPNVIDLTLIDLPGMVKIPLKGSRADIKEMIEKIILNYIEKNNCLILAVLPAADIAISDALEMAKKVDPERIRTIGVVTKLDLMNKGTSARDYFENEKYPLRRGYVGIKNRTQEDINENKDISKALEDEREFFEKHEEYRHIAHRMGTPYLQKLLNQQLTEHIREKLPSLVQKLSKEMALLEKDIGLFEELHGNPETMKRRMIEYASIYIT